MYRPWCFCHQTSLWIELQQDRAGRKWIRPYKDQLKRIEPPVKGSSRQRIKHGVNGSSVSVLDWSFWYSSLVVGTIELQRNKIIKLWRAAMPVLYKWRIEHLKSHVADYHRVCRASDHAGWVWSGLFALLQSFLGYYQAQSINATSFGPDARAFHWLAHWKFAPNPLK